MNVHLFSGVILTLFCTLLSSCAPLHPVPPPPAAPAAGPAVSESAPPVPDENLIELENRVTRLKQDLANQRNIANDLRQKLFVSYQRADECQQTNQKLLTELVQDKTKLRSRGTRIDAVTLLAETTARIDGLTSNQLNPRKRLLIQRAQYFLEEGRMEFEKNNFDGAAAQYRKAGELITLAELDSVDDIATPDGVEVNFAIPLQMELIKNSNIRIAPSVESEVKLILTTGSLVQVIGFKENWAKIELAEEETPGWIYSSLLR